MRPSSENPFDRPSEYERRQQAAAERELPALLAFKAACRKALPAPELSALTPAEREQGRITLDLLAQELHVPAGQDNVRYFKLPVVLATTLVGIAVIEPQLEDAQRKPIVALTTEERNRWFDDNPTEDDPWWFRTVDCSVVEWTESTQNLFLNDPEISKIIRKSVQPGETPWVVERGGAFGALAGEWRTDLWVWNGAVATFRTELCLTVS